MTPKTRWFRKSGLTVIALAFSLYAGLSQAAYEVNFQTPATQLGRDVYDLHMWMMYVITVVFIAVFGMMFYSIFAHRKSRGHKAAQFHDNVAVEIAWTIIPLLILVVMAIPATKTILKMRDTTNPDITIKATGYQWKWGYDYLKGEGAGISFKSNLTTPQDQIRNKAPKGENYLLEVDNVVVVPIGKKIRILTTANDVIHSWAVPALAVKQDAIPGFVRDTSFRADREGVYRGQCSELCGKDHGFMPIVVHVVSAGKYTQWVDDQKKLMAATADDPTKTYTAEEMKARGEKVYATNCAACHQATGKGIPGTFPALDGDKTVLGPKEAQINIVLNGRPGTAMANFGKQLNDVEIAAVITYTRNAWGNKTGETIQPADVTAGRK